MAEITGAFDYKGLIVAQHEEALPVFAEFFAAQRPARILEIGTGGGGFTLFMRDALDAVGLKDTQIKSFDIQEREGYEDLRENHDIEINIINIFGHNYNFLDKPYLVEDYIKGDGVTIVLCDGHNKVKEFNILAPFLKRGDFIMAHDYAPNAQFYENKIKNKRWNWWEIGDKDVVEACATSSLEPHHRDEFMQVLWLCCKRVRPLPSSKEMKILKDFIKTLDPTSLMGKFK